MVKQLCFAHNANKKAKEHISLHICGFISFPFIIPGSFISTLPVHAKRSPTLERIAGPRRFTKKRCNGHCVVFMVGNPYLLLPISFTCLRMAANRFNRLTRRRCM